MQNSAASLDNGRDADPRENYQLHSERYSESLRNNSTSASIPLLHNDTPRPPKDTAAAR